jgi:O-succinylbenzoic acid--CoA ligase
MAASSSLTPSQLPPVPFDLAQLRQRDWLLGNSDRQSQVLNQTFRQAWDDRLQALNSVMAKLPHPPLVLIAEADPIVFLGSVAAALESRCPIALGNPAWAIAEWQAAVGQVRPQVIWAADRPMQPPGDTTDPAIARPSDWVLIPTGGTSGQIRFVIHTWHTLMTATAGFQQHFDRTVVNSCCVLPLYHVSGLMQVMRVWRSQGQLALTSFREFATESFWTLDPTAFFISLVPTQLQRVMHQPAVRDWLQDCVAVLLGGGPSWPSLRSHARQHQIPIALTYGMTETAAQVATLHPAQFLAGHESCGTALPHVAIACVDDQGNRLPPGEPGIIQLQSESLCLGYVPTGGLHLPFLTDDVGYLDASGELHPIGRHSTKLITGGENVFPEEVEAVIRETGDVADVAVVGIPDRIWGDRIAAVFVPSEVFRSDPQAQPTQPNLPPTVAIALNRSLSRYKHPKLWIPVNELPHQSNGKLNRPAVQAIAQQWLQQQNTSDRL